MMDVEARLASVRRKMRDEGVGAAVISMRSNMLYLTAFDGVIDHGISAACAITEDHARFYTDGRYIDAAREAAGEGPWDVVLQGENLYIDCCDQLQADGVTSLLLESEVPYGRFTFISQQFRGAIRVVDQLVETARMIKEAEEIERIAAAAAIADKAFEHLLGFIKTGMTEREIALELEFFMRRNGAEEMAFDPIVASGPNSARPHAIPGERRLAPGDLLVLDFGAKVGGYCSDMTRTVAIGSPSDAQRRLYEAVLEANEAGLAAVRSGLPCVEVDRAARDVLVGKGLGELFTHGLGHGVGIDIHEMPTVGQRSTQSLRSGAVVTIEPGVYESGVGGVRIEDLVVVEESGYRLLTNAPKELIEL
jgi:Xaa-Pro aminopeptidase